ncbi:MAG: aspartyl protease family protein [Nitrospirota bacterium]
MTTGRSTFSALALLAALTAPFIAAGADIFTWTDERGTIHFSDSTSDVPARYRHSIKAKQFGPDDTSPPANAPAAPQLSDDDEEMAPPAGSQAPVAQTRKRFEVPYQAYEGNAKRLLVSARFNDRVTARMILDTGAPRSLISMNVANDLGLLDDDQGQLVVAIGGIGGSTTAIRTVINSIQIGGARIEFVPVEISKSISDAFEGLIGMDFLGDYSMSVDPTKRLVIFEEVPDTTDRPGGRDETWWRNTFSEFAAYHNHWKQTFTTIEKELTQTSVTTARTRGDLERRRDLAKRQSQEAEKLMDRLHRFAREHAVPMHWRTY